MHLPNDWFEAHFKGIPLVTILQGEQDRLKFFNKIFTEIGVNLLDCAGKPPLSWVDKVKSKRAQRRGKKSPSQSRSSRPERRADNRREHYSQASRGDNSRYRPYDRRQNVNDANLRAMPSPLLHNPSLGPRHLPYDIGHNSGPWVTGHEPMIENPYNSPNLSHYNLRSRYAMVPFGQNSMPMAGYGPIGGLHYNAL